MSRRVMMGVVALVGVVSCLSLGQECQTLLAQADLLYDPQVGDFDFAAYESRLREAIGLYEQALPLVPADDVATQLTVLRRLARAHFELGKAYLPKGDDQEASYVAGRDYALAALRLDPDFVEREKQGFRDALSNSNDIEAVFWYGNNLGLYLNYDQLNAILGGGMFDVRACYERAAALDEAFLAAGPLRSLASFLAQVPGFLGGDRTRARELFERAIALAPEFLENHTACAANVLDPSEAAYCQTLAAVRAAAADPVVMDAWPLYNTLAVRDADALFAQGGCP